MYKYSVPIMLHTINDENRYQIAQNLKECGIERLFLCPHVYLFEKSEIDYADAKSKIEFFKSQGLEVGIWVSSFGHGCALTHENGTSEVVDNITRLEGIDNITSEFSACPFDDAVVEVFSDRIKKIAETGPDLIMFDDDYRLNIRNYKMGCACHLHLEEYYKRIGEVIPKEKLEAKIFSGNKNKYRTEWLKLMGETLVGFAKKMREAVDSVNSNIRLGVCGCFDTWDYEGTDCIEITKALAGNTKPFLRTFGAPYHSAKISEAVEATRAQAFWCKNSGVEIFSEGDVYPRPRYIVPSRQLELFDLTLIAAGGMDGALKYMYDYVQPFGYETGYTDRHIKNAPLRECLHEIFDDKKTVGIRVVDVLKKTENWHLPEEENIGYESFLVMAFQINKNAKTLLTDNAIPTTYEGDALPVFVMGENAWYVGDEELNNGAILDSAAAEILTQRGFDVGLINSEKTDASSEEYLKEKDTITLLSKIQLSKIECNKKAIVETVLKPNNTVGSYRYENDKGQRFFVLACDLMHSKYDDNRNSTYLSNYYRKSQLVSAIEYVSRKKMAAKTVSKSPYLYMLASENKVQTELSVGIANPFIDDAFDVIVELGKKYSSVKFINCEGEFNGDSVKIKYIEPYGFAAFEVTE